jgi:hypothetical protein
MDVVNEKPGITTRDHKRPQETTRHLQLDIIHWKIEKDTNGKPLLVFEHEGTQKVSLKKDVSALVSVGLEVLYKDGRKVGGLTSISTAFIEGNGTQLKASSVDKGIALLPSFRFFFSYS